MRHLRHRLGDRSQHPWCGLPLPHSGRVKVLVIIILLASAVGLAALTPTVAASIAALVQSGVAVCIALRHPAPATAEG
ncbi:hypothetical protein GCM10010228_77630 [Streptomyces massasporeus]|nr:hypothetical protein GCM10010228_77630 [Streptomyces massasporeus]